MEELIELSKSTEKYVNELYQLLQDDTINGKRRIEISNRYLDKINFLKLINIIIKIK